MQCVYCAVRTGSLNTNHVNFKKCLSREMFQVVSGRLLTEFDPRLVHVGFVVNKVAIGQGFSTYFAFPCEYHSTKNPMLKGCCNGLYLVEISGLWIHLGFIAHNTSLPAQQLPLLWSHTALSCYTVHLLLHSTTHTLLER